MKKYLAALALSFAAIPLIATAQEAATPATVVDIAVSNPDFSTLVAAVQAADLVETLSSEGPFTVFAPTDAAFAAALEALGLSAEELGYLPAAAIYYQMSIEESKRPMTG